MNLFAIAWKSIKQRSLSSFLTALSVGLGVMLTIAVLVFSSIVTKAFSQESVGYDLVVGPKGSDVGLVLGAVYRISPLKQPMPYQYYLDLKEHGFVKEAVPLAIADFTEEGNYPIVATESTYFDVPYADGKTFRVVEGSQRITNDFDAVIGAEVAEANGWTLGSKFKLIHAGDESHVHDDEFTVVAVLKRTGTPNDKSVFVNIEGFFQLDEHDLPVEMVRRQWVDYFGEERTRRDFDPVANKEKARREKEAEEHAGGDHDGHHHHHAMPDELKQINAVFVNAKKSKRDFGTGKLQLEADINKTIGAQAVNPTVALRTLKETIIGNIRLAMLVMTTLIILVSGVGIFVSIYNSMADRKKEIAIMRALGAQRTMVLSIILAESTLLCVIGGLCGMALGHAIIFVVAPWFESYTGLVIDSFAFEPVELIVLPALILLASLVGLLPGLTAYRTDVAGTLAE